MIQLAIFEKEGPDFSRFCLERYDSMDLLDTADGRQVTVTDIERKRLTHVLEKAVTADPAGLDPKSKAKCDEYANLYEQMKVGAERTIRSHNQQFES